MQQPISLRPQDVAVIVKLLVIDSEKWIQTDLASSLMISQGEIAKALARLKKASLVHGKRVNRTAALEFLLHAVKYMFPAEVGALVVGVPTGLSAPAHQKMVVQKGGDTYVWPSIHGEARGQMIKPLYPKLGEAALLDRDFYGIMSAIEIVRIGRSRERNLAAKYLEKKIMKA